MTTATIDLDTLDKLFDNQKKLDDIFSSFFDDDDCFLDSPIPSHNNQALENSSQKNNQDIYSTENLSFHAEDNYFIQKKRSVTSFLLPLVLEVAAIYYGIVYFT
ncbi:MAG: hypothetical protein KAQ91_09610 [Methylococcales bacterium]|nr:hypothetical protein [Methylococcales bacterium]